MMKLDIAQVAASRTRLRREGQKRHRGGVRAGWPVLSAIRRGRRSPDNPSATERESVITVSRAPSRTPGTDPGLRETGSRPARRRALPDAVRHASDYSVWVTGGASFEQSVRRDRHPREPDQGETPV